MNCNALCATGLDHNKLLVKPLKGCADDIEGSKLRTASLYSDMAVWSLSLLRAMCPRWDSIVENEDKEQIKLNAFRVLF